MGLLAPAALLDPNRGDLVGGFSFDDTGYVKDDDKDKLDADKLLKVIKEGNDAAKTRKAKNTVPRH